MKKTKNCNKTFNLLFVFFMLLFLNIAAAYTAPVLIFPVEKIAMTAAEINFIWNSDNQNTQYILEVSKDTEFNPLVYRKETYLLDDQIEENIVLFSAGRYFWRVGEKKNTGIDFSDSSFFEILEKIIEPVIVEKKIETLVYTDTVVIENEVEKIVYVKNDMDTKIQEQLVKSEEINDKLKVELEDMTNVIEILNKKYNVIIDEKSKLEKQLEDEKQTSAAEKRKNISLVEENKILETDLKKMFLMKTELENKLQNELQLNAIEKQKNIILATENQTITNKFENIVEKNAILEKQISDFQIENQNMEKEIVNINQQLKIQYSIVDEYKNKNSDLENQIQQLKLDISKVTLEYNNFIAASNNKDKEMLLLKEENAEYANKLAELEKQYAFSNLKYGELLSDADKYRPTIEKLEKTIQLLRTQLSEMQFEKISKSVNASDFNNALKDIEKLKSIDADNDALYYNAAVINYKLKDYNKALVEINEALKINPASRENQKLKSRIQLKSR
ncbi:hypothetical protein KA977_09440 [Candidatus Dependentiae bacterium]|nr:hypothetical protein [Candidatus Dependentiae bacterium]